MAFTTINKSSAFQANNNYNGTGSTLNLTGFNFFTLSRGAFHKRAVIALSALSLNKGTKLIKGW